MSASEGWAATALETTVPELFFRNATDYPGHAALTDITGGTQRTWTWSQAHAETSALAAGLSELGLQRGQTMLIMMANRAEHWLADAAATQIGAVPSTVYATSSPDQVLFVARHSRVRIAVLESAEQVRRWSSALRELPMLNHVVVLDETAIPEDDPRFVSWKALHQLGERVLNGNVDLVEQRWRALSADQPVTVLYTSGTTGNPKGVVLTHRNVVYAAAALHQVTETPPHAPIICYLPLAHIAERMLSMYAAIHEAAHVHFCADPTAVAGKLPEVRPHTFFGVPRVWEKLAALLHSVPVEQRCTPEAVERLRAQVGLDQTVWLSSGAAPISSDVLEFFASLGVHINELWGMTETTGCATTNRPGANRLGTVGQPVPGVELRTADDGEVLVRGPIVCAGYLQPDGAISPATDSDGWLHTGDVGSIDDDRYLTITDRKKELIISSGGKNIAPTAVENALTTHPLIGHALAFGDRRPYVVALLVLDEDAAPAWASARGIEVTDLAALAEHPAVLSEVDDAVATANSKLNRPEQVKRYRLLGKTWGTEGGELTPTLKLKRRVIHARYSDVLDDLYT